MQAFTSCRNGSSVTAGTGQAEGYRAGPVKVQRPDVVSRAGYEDTANAAAHVVETRQLTLVSVRAGAPRSITPECVVSTKTGSRRA